MLFNNFLKHASYPNIALKIIELKHVKYSN